MKGKTAIAGKLCLSTLRPANLLQQGTLLAGKNTSENKGWPMIRDHAIEKVKSGVLDIFSCELIVGSLTSDPLEEFDMEELKRLASYES